MPTTKYWKASLSCSCLSVLFGCCYSQKSVKPFDVIILWDLGWKKKKPSSSKQTPKCSGHSNTTATTQLRRVAKSPSTFKKLPPGWRQDINLIVLPLTDTPCKQTRLAVCMGHCSFKWQHCKDKSSRLRLPCITHQGDSRNKIHHQCLQMFNL